MELSKAVAERMQELLDEKNMTRYQLFKRTGVGQSTIASVFNNSHKNPAVTTIYQLCIGLDISLAQFFDSPLFDRENLDD